MRLALLFIPVSVFRFLFVFLSPLVWFFLWFPEEVLALLFLLHCENGDFSILMKDIFPRYLGCGCELLLETKPQHTLLKNLLSIVERGNFCAHVQAAPVCC